MKKPKYPLHPTKCTPPIVISVKLRKKSLLLIIIIARYKIAYKKQLTTSIRNADAIYEEYSDLVSTDEHWIDSYRKNSTISLCI
ncbi:hypothetical protein KAH81_09320 [bacterium]|nr:hypothetical protein [bacterium]